MFVQSKGTTYARHKNGLPITQRRGGRDTLVQWENGARRWEPTHDLEGTITLMGSVVDDEDLYDV
jgi:hypothetical protein